MADQDPAEENAVRRAEEFEALEAFYGDRVKGGEGGPWTINIGSGIDLEMELLPSYPSTEAPTPRVVAPAFVVAPSAAKALEAELLAMYQPDTEVAILWAEHVRASVVEDVDGYDDNEPRGHDDETEEEPAAASPDPNGELEPPTGTLVFHPYNGSKYGQPIRRFEASVVQDEAHARPIHRGTPFHPPKSGPSETMLAHVATVESMEQVDWVLAKLLLEDKKVARATHNMIAYRFRDSVSNRLVSDNDDDGEKGAGQKLAALLDMAACENTMVVVSRWYGGIHLGPARFKHIASTARDALEEAGLLPPK